MVEMRLFSPAQFLVEFVTFLNFFSHVLQGLSRILPASGGLMRFLFL